MWLSDLEELAAPFGNAEPTKRVMTEGTASARVTSSVEVKVMRAPESSEEKQSLRMAPLELSCIKGTHPSLHEASGTI